MPVANAVVDDNAVPPVDVAYHCNAVPVATKFDTVADVQNVCEEAVGAVGVVELTVEKLIVDVDVPL